MNAPTSPLHLLPTVNQRPVPAALIEALQAHFGARCSTAMVVREQHGRDESPFDVPPPGAVVFAQNTDEVAMVVKLAAIHRVPVIPFGVGTSLEGHITAPYGGITVDLSQMNTILSVNAADLDARVEAGVTRKASRLTSGKANCARLIGSLPTTKHLSHKFNNRLTADFSVKSCTLCKRL